MSIYIMKTKQINKRRRRRGPKVLGELISGGGELSKSF